MSLRYPDRAALIETIGTLACLVILIGCVVPLFIRSFGLSSHAASLDDATVIAQNALELHAAAGDGESFASLLGDSGYAVHASDDIVTYSDGDYEVSCLLSDTGTDRGTLHEISVDVSKGDRSIYSLSSACYESGRAA